MPSSHTNQALLHDKEVNAWLTRRWEKFFGPRDFTGSDDFLHLGGHSILAIRLIAEAYEAFGAALSIGDIFQHRTRASLAQVIIGRSGGESTQTIESIPRADRSAPLPLSPTQEYLFFESLLNADQPVYNEVATLHLGEQLEIASLKKAFNMFINRHDAFRTAYSWESGQLRQEVRSVDPVDIPEKDFRRFATSEREARAQAFASDWARKLFDLKIPPLIRAFLGMYSKTDTRLHIVAHHLAIDAFTLFDLLPKELYALYADIRGNRSPSLPQPPAQYPDFAVWRKKRSQELRPENLDYWKEKLSGFQATILPGDQAIASTRKAQGARQVFHLEEDLTNRVNECAAQSSTTPFVVLLTAFKALLFKRLRHSDLVVGSVTGGREHPQSHEVAGCFLHFVVLRNQLSGRMTIRKCIEGVSKTVRGAMQHQEVPLLEARDAVKSHSAPSNQPLYRIMFLMEPPQDSLPGGWTVNQLEFHPGTSKLDLTFELDEKHGRFFGRVEYRTSLYSDDFIDRMIEEYEELLGRLVRHPEAALDSVLRDHPGPRPVPIPDKTPSSHSRNPEIRLYDPMEAIARESPKRIALEFGLEQMTYGQLKEHSDNIAEFLQEQGMGRGNVVAVVARRSLWLQAALFGVIKSGAAYLPIDPDLPDSRVEYLLKDSQSGYALLDPEVSLPEGTAIGCHGIHDAALNSGNGTFVDQAQPDDLAYVLYTSGSTGHPKGAMIEHRSVVNRLQWMVHEYEFTDTDVQIQKTPITFDVSLHELFLWSFVGARLAIPPPGAERDPGELVRLIRTHQVTQIHFVPSMLEVFLAYLTAFDKADALASLRHVHCSGEALPPPTVQAFQEQIGTPLGVRIHNLYGPTEAAVDVTYFDCSEFSGGTSVPIGKPVWNTQLYVLDETLRRVADGQPGELYIGGLQVGRGYINQPELTKAAFIPDPFCNEAGARLYKTGDQARWLDDGNLEYLGRNDFQIKVRGVRIEPAEIENAMRRFPGITGAICVARKNDNGDTQLVAYFTYSSHDDPSIKDSLADHLRQALPPQMVPSILFQMEEFPLNASGKLDRKALPNVAPEERNAPASGHGKKETVLIEAWETVLQLKNVSPEDDFFELGGDSILAIRVISIARQKGYLITLRNFFENSGLRQMATAMDPLPDEAKPTGKQTEVAPLNPIQNWFLGLGLSRPSHWNQSRLLELDESVNKNVLENSLRYVVANHASLRLRFRNEGCGWTQELIPDFPEPVLEIIDASSFGEADLAESCAKVQGSLDIQSGPLMRAVCFVGSSDNRCRLFLCFHHLVIDGVSWQILLEDLEATIGALASGTQPQLPPEVTNSLDWACILKAYAETGLTDDEVAFWKSLQGSTLQQIPADQSSMANQVQDIREHKISLGQEETDQLLHEVPSRYNTEINDVLLTALGMLLRKAGRRDEVTFFLEGHGREWVHGVRDLSRTTGWFTALFPLRLEVGVEDIGSLVKSVKEQIRAVPGRGLGFGLKHTFLDRGDRHESIKPELVFNYLGNMDRQLSGLRLIKKEHIPWESEMWSGDERPWIHEILAWVKDGQLTVAWYTDGQAFSESTVDNLLREYMGHLRAIIRHCLDNNAGGYTPSDFESAGLSQDELDELYSDFDDNN